MLRPRQQEKLARGAKDEEHAMSPKLNAGIAVIGDALAIAEEVEV